MTATRDFLHRRKGLTAAIVAGVIATSGVALRLSTRSDQAGGPGQTINVSGSGNAVNQNCGQVSGNSTCIVQLQSQVDQASKANPGTDDADFKKTLAHDATAHPATPGPWPFVVVDTGTDGLYARTSNQIKADYLGIAPDRSIVWADCLARSDFTPPGLPGGTDLGPSWAHVRWAPAAAPTAAGVSQPAETRRAWMYHGFLLPLQHNGHIPGC